jgi:hypothetical protein
LGLCLPSLVRKGVVKPGFILVKGVCYGMAGRGKRYHVRDIAEEVVIETGQVVVMMVTVIRLHTLLWVSHRSFPDGIMSSHMTSGYNMAIPRFL